VEEKDFYQKYWYTNAQLITVKNPRPPMMENDVTGDYLFSCVVQTGIDISTGKAKEESRQYLVKAGGTESFPGPIANIYLDQMSKLLAQDEGKIQHMIDFSLRAAYYDRLTTEVRDLTAAYQQQTPDYLKPATAEAPVGPPEEAFAGAKEKTPEKPAPTKA
jgi:hypothetical protein